MEWNSSSASDEWSVGPPVAGPVVVYKWAPFHSPKSPVSR